MSISLVDVSIHLGKHRVVEGVSADLGGGALVGIIGPNGAGKSTLIRAMLGLLPAASGAIRIDDTLITDISRQSMARRLAYLPQGQTLHWPLCVERLVALGRLPHLGPLGRPGAADAAAIADAMNRTGVAAWRHRDATRLSGGERARVMLARALAVGAPGLIVDEPLASLDPGHQIDVMELLTQDARRGTLVVAVLHDLTLAARYCDRLLLIAGGRLIADGPPAQVLTAERLADVYGISALVHHDQASPIIIPLARA